VELNKTINWKPKSTGEGRFGHWLENLVDWNLSRSRFWGTPLPIWRTADVSEVICIGSLDELVAEIEKANTQLGLNQSIDRSEFDLHRPYVDRITLVSPTGKPMQREADLIDVWFDSGAMPYAQWHYPFENIEQFEKNYPADFIAEGVDQTRGWFFTLHTLATLLFDQVAFKNVIANGLVLDKHGNKMSKRLGNAIDPFETVDQYGADAVRWYMTSNSQPWDNLKFDLSGVQETQRKFLGTLYNTYGFFALYANVDGFQFKAEEQIPMAERPELDRWILSRLNSLIAEAEAAFDDYDPTRAARAIEDFVTEHLSNWYVRLSRRRFWKGDMNPDKQAAYETLYTCLDAVSRIMSPVAPFFSDWLYRSLNNDTRVSVHLCNWPICDHSARNADLEAQMDAAQNLCSLVLSLRKKEKIKVRQPLQKLLVPVSHGKQQAEIERVRDLILSETNVKELEFVSADSEMLIKRIKPNFKTLGKQLGPDMKAMSNAVQVFGQEEIRQLEQEGHIRVDLGNRTFDLHLADVEISTQDMPGWLVATDGAHTVALDISINDELRLEGIARELINRIQNMRKDSGFDLTDRIAVEFSGSEELRESVIAFKNYICGEVLANSLQYSEKDHTSTDEIDGQSIGLTLIKA